ncbi:MAG: PKD domain-containing protein, partial [Solirubrobacteraceae bacterium]
AQGSPGMSVAQGSKVMNLGIKVYTGPGNTGLQLAGTARNVAITAQPGVTYAIGVELDGATFGHGSVALPINVSEPTGYGGVIGDGTVSDSTIRAAIGVTDDGTNAKTPRVNRDRIVANQGVLIGVNSPVIDDAVIHTVGGPSTEMGVSTAPNTVFGNFAIRHTTIVGSHTAGSTGVHADANGMLLPASTSVLIDSTILHGYVNSINAVATSGPFPASTTVTVRHTFYDPVASHSTTDATIDPDDHSGNIAPFFINAAAGNFQLRAGSPAIDDGSATLGSGESTTDLAGKPRRIIGHKGDAHISDVGAFEFRPHVPHVHATASKLQARVGQPVTFHATGTDASPRDHLSFHWSFGKVGATVKHAFSTPGKHTVSVKATDLDHFTATAHVTVTVH